MVIRRALEILIVFVVGLVLGPFLPMSLSAPQSYTTLDRANLATATSFYAAANRFLEIGDDAPLLALLDASFVDHSLPGREPTTAGLFRYLTSLRAAYPEIRLEATLLATQQDVVTVSLATTPAPTAIIGGPIPDWEPAVPGIEQLRIRDGSVAERWASGLLPPQVEQVATVDLNQPAGWFVKVEMERIELESGVSLNRRDAGPSLLIVSAGTLSLEADRESETELQVIMQRGRMMNSSLPGGAVHQIGSESVLTVPKALAYRIWNEQPETVIAVRIEFAYRAPSTTFVQGAIDQVGSTQGVFIYSQAAMLPPDVNNDRPFQLKLIRISATSKATLPVHTVGEIEQAFVTTGALTTKVYAGSVSVPDQDGLVSEPLEGARELFAGDFLTAHPDALLSYQVTSADPASVWFVSIVRTSVLRK